MKELISNAKQGLFGIFILSLSACTENPSPKADSLPAKTEMTHSDMVLRGKYMVNSLGCGDCHTPKHLKGMDMVPDSGRILSGHVSTEPLNPIDKKNLKSGNWILFSPDLTVTVGPWGISYSANLTPDSTTGLGNWTADQFLQTIRTGKHMGQPGGRDILPPMPVQDLAQLNDEDLKSIFTYLQSLPAVHNQVPAPVPPTALAN